MNQPDLDYSRDFATSVRSLDHEATARELKDAVPSLRYVFVTSNGCFSGVRIPKEENSERADWEPAYDLVTRGWFNTRTGWTDVDIDRPDVPLQHLRKLNDETIEGIVRSQDLLINPEDEVSMHEYHNYSFGPYLCSATVLAWDRPGVERRGDYRLATPSLKKVLDLPSLTSFCY